MEYEPERVQKVRLDDLVFNEWNPKSSEREYVKIKHSIEFNGLMTPVFVRESSRGLELVDGAHRVRACRELGYTEIYVYNLGKISEEEAKALALWLQVQVPFDEISLAPLVMSLDKAEISLPYDEREMARFEGLTSFDMDTAFEDDEPIEEDVPENKLYYKIRLEQDDYNKVLDRIHKVSKSEVVSDGRALELLLVAGVENKVKMG